MNKLLFLVFSSVGGGVGWWIGAKIGIMTGYVLSVIGTGIAIYFWRVVVRNYLE